MITNKWAIGIDIGATKMAILAVDLEGNILQKLLYSTKNKGSSAVEGDIIAAVEQLKNTFKSSPACIGIGIAGQIDTSNGFIYFSPNLNWLNVPLTKNLQQALSIPIFIINDVHAATWGEWKLGIGKNCKDLVCLFIGTGIGGGIICNGCMLTGSSNTAAEIGHMIIDLHGPLCTCGNYGCLESLASGWAIAKRAQKLVTENPEAGNFLLQTVDGDINAITARNVEQGFRANDPLSKDLIISVADALIAGSISIVHAINPERLVLGGGIIYGLPELVPIIEAGILKHALKAATANLQVLPSSLQTDSGTLGASLLALHSLCR